MPRLKRAKGLEIDPVDNTELTSNTEYEEAPSITDYKWTDYVLSQLEESEMWLGIPRVDGLRRLVEKLVSHITATESRVQAIVSEYPYLIVTVKVFLNNGSFYEASADAHSTSVTREYANRLTAVAENRALSRAYRMILRLGNIISDADVSSMQDLSQQEPITKTQIDLITKILADERCSKINLSKLLEHILGTPKRLADLKFSEGSKIIEALGNYKNNRVDIPKEIL